MIDVKAAYAEVAHRLATTMSALDGDAWSTPVRSCPGWSVKDVLAHHVGAVADSSTGNAPEIPPGVDFLRDFDQVIGTVFADLSARQVAERTTHVVDDLLLEWEAATERFWRIHSGQLPDPGFPIPPAVGQAVLVNDVVVHEGDVRQAVGLPPAPETPALALALGNYALTAAMHFHRAGLGALVLEYGGRQRLVGDGDPVATLRASRHDLVRTLAGRRSRDQILAMEWEGDPSAHADLLPAYGVVSPADADRL